MISVAFQLCCDVDVGQLQVLCFGLSDWDSQEGRGIRTPTPSSQTVVSQSSPVLLGLMTFMKCLNLIFMQKILILFIDCLLKKIGSQKSQTT